MDVNILSYRDSIDFVRNSSSHKEALNTDSFGSLSKGKQHIVFEADLWENNRSENGADVNYARRRENINNQWNKRKGEHKDSGIIAQERQTI